MAEVEGSCESVNSSVYLEEHVREKDANCFECEHIYERNLASQILNCAVDGSRITTNISHVPEERADYLHEDIRPSMFIEGASVIDRGNGAVDRLSDLL